MTTFFSFGGGVQSCGIAALLMRQELEYKPDLILFADTGAEPPKIYEQVDIVFNRLREVGYQCEIVKAPGKITDEPTNGRGGLSTLPFFIKGESGRGMLRRQCTNEYKIKPLHQRMRSYLGLKPYQRSKEIHKLMMGISIEETQRATQPKEKWLQAVFPLIDLKLDRTKCALLAWEVFRFVPKKSSCFMCPFTHPQEWERRKAEEPELFEMAVKFDESMNDYTDWAGVKGEVFIHPRRVRLKDAVNSQMQLDLSGMQRDCGGHCWT